MSDIRTQSSMGAAAGDTGTVVAMFETYDRARAARDVLVSAGIDRSRIEVLAQSSGAEDASFHYERNDEGIWGAIKSLFMPDDESHLYAEGIRRGYAMLVVRTGAGDQEQIISLLESQDAVDVETHAASGARAGGPACMRVKRRGRRSSDALARDRISVATSSVSSGVATGTAGRGQEEVIPVYEEQLRVGKREVGRGSVRVGAMSSSSPSKSRCICARSAFMLSAVRSIGRRTW